jgi:Cu/Ag efflux protein CusF
MSNSLSLNSIILAACFVMGGGMADAKSKMITGTIEKVDLHASTLTIKAEGHNEGQQSQTVTLNDDTVYKVNGKESSQAAFKSGDKVTVELGNRNVAKTVDVQSQS